jgi:hypothetical protein
MHEAEPPTSPRSKRRLRTQILGIVVIVAVAGGIALIVDAAVGGSSSKEPAAVSSAAAKRVTTAGQDMLGGNAHPSYPDGDPGEIAVVALGPITYDASGGTLPLAIRNNTKAAVSRITITGIAEDQNGTQLAVGSSQEQVQPAQLAPAALGYSYIHFAASDPQVPPNSVYEFTIKSNPADTSAFNTASVKITKSTATADAITGVASNTTGSKLQGPYAVQAFCFDDQGNLIAAENVTATKIGDVPVGGSVNFAIPLNGTSCANYLVGISGLYG